MMRTLESRNPLGAVMPTRMQLHYKIQHCKKLVAKTQKIANTGDLEAISKQFDIPVDLTDCFVAYHEVIDDQGHDNVRFIVIWTSQKMQARVLTNSQVCKYSNLDKYPCPM